MNVSFSSCALFCATLLSGFYAGTGFFMAMGGNPAIRLMSDHTFAEFWQHVDHYMAARMQVFGPLLLLSLIASLFALRIEWRSLPFWLLAAALALLVADTLVIFRINHPLNHLIQSWNLNNLPGNVQEIKAQVTSAFTLRLTFMMATFGLVLLSVWLRLIPSAK